LIFGGLLAQIQIFPKGGVAGLDHVMYKIWHTLKHISKPGWKAVDFKFGTDAHGEHMRSNGMAE